MSKNTPFYKNLHGHVSALEIHAQPGLWSVSLSPFAWVGVVALCVIALALGFHDPESATTLWNLVTGK